MTPEFASLVLEQLRAIRAELSEVRGMLRDNGRPLTSLEVAVDTGRDSTRRDLAAMADAVKLGESAEDTEFGARMIEGLREALAWQRGEISLPVHNIAGVDARVTPLAANDASELLTIEKRLSEQIAGLRRAVMEYHSSAIGHGVLFTEIDERLRRVEQHLNMPSGEPH